MTVQPSDHEVFCVIQEDDVDQLNAFLLQGMDPNRRDDFARTPLHHAAALGAVDCTQRLIEAGADIRAEDHVTSRPVSEAANLEIVRLLLDTGADIDHMPGTGYTVLKAAAEAGNTEMVHGLLAMGATPDASTLNDTALRLAVREDHYEIVQLLLAAGADPNAQTVPDGWFPLQSVKSVAVAKLLLDAGADINLRDTSLGANVVDDCQNIELLAFLIAEGAEANPTEPGTSIPLHSAVSSGNLPKTQLLLDHGAEVNRATSWGKTALMDAAERDLEEFTALLIRRGADVNLADENLHTALYYAAAPEGFTAYQLMQSWEPLTLDDLIDSLPEEARQHLDEELLASAERPTYGYVASDSVTIIEMLLEAGADLEARDADGMTPLLFTASCGRPARVKALLKAGAGSSAVDMTSRTIQDIAREHPDEDHRVEILNMLRHLPDPPNADGNPVE